MQHLLLQFIQKQTTIHDSQPARHLERLHFPADNPISRRNMQFPADKKRIAWVHANRGAINGGVACVCAKWRVFAHFVRFCAFFVRFLCVFFVPKWPAEKRKFAHNRAKNVQKALFCNTPFSYTHFCVSPNCRRVSRLKNRER